MRPSRASRRRSTRSARCGPASACRRRRPGLPPIQPMFPPTHRIPIVIAAYRKAFVELAGQKADGYLARPAESIPSLRGILERLRASAVAAGRDPHAIEIGRLPALARRQDPPRGAQPREARAVRHLHDVGAVRRVAGAGRVRHASCATGSPPPGGPRTTRPPATSSPTSCSTRSCCAGRARTWPPGAMAFHAQTGLQLPLLQPVLQEDRQIDELIAAAAIYASVPDCGDGRRPVGRRARPRRRRGRRRAAPAGATAGRVAGHEPRRRSSARAPATALGRRAGALYEILRPFAFTASVIPVLAGAALAWVDELWNWAPFIAALLGARVPPCRHEHRQRGLRRPEGRRLDHEPAGQPRDREGPDERADRASVIAGVFFALAVVVGVYLVWLRGPAIVVLGVLGLIGGWGYTAPPLEYKNRALGVPIVFLLMGPLMVEGSYFAVSGTVVARRRWCCRSRSGCSSRRSSTATSGATSARTAGPGSRRCRRGSAGAGRTTGTSRSSSARTSCWPCR